MRVLVINADDIRINSSANLCHMAYINGLIENGCNVDVICAKKDIRIDSSIQFPAKARLFTFDGISYYESLSSKITRNRSGNLSSQCIVSSENISVSEGETVNKSFKSKLKEFIRGFYGVHGFHISFIRRAMKYRNEMPYDFVISLSDPPASHELAHQLIKRRHIKTKKWIQIWEDPWLQDLYNREKNDAVFKTEKKLLSYADKVCYVTPLTLENQKKAYPESASKMYWQPLPSYYTESDNVVHAVDNLCFGYFGDYFPFSRNIEPFYQAVTQLKMETYICGNPNNLLPSNDWIHIFPRMSLAELKQYEDKVGVLVFLCNLSGGQIPGKIYQYSATGKKILFILDGTEYEKEILKQYFSQYHRYYFCENTMDDICMAIQAMKDGENADVVNEPINFFSPQSIVNKILKGAD